MSERQNPYATALAVVAIVGIVVGGLTTITAAAATLGLGLLVTGGVCLAGWLVVSALAWQRRR